MSQNVPHLPHFLHLQAGLPIIVIYLSPFFNAKIVFRSLPHFLIPSCFEEKPRETCYHNSLIFATWKLC